jgi:hypothetical protein
VIAYGEHKEEKYVSLKVKSLISDSRKRKLRTCVGVCQSSKC